MERSHRGSQGEGAPEAACDPQPSESYGPGDSSEASCPSTSEVRREQVRRPGASSHPGGADGEAGALGRGGPLCSPLRRITSEESHRAEGRGRRPGEGEGRSGGLRITSEENHRAEGRGGRPGRERAALQPSEESN